MSAYLTDVIILLIAAVIAVPIFKLLKLGVVPAFIVAGMIIGPYGLAIISNISEISHLAEIGVVFLLFLIGVELKPSQLWQMRKLVFGLGLFQVILTSLAIGLILVFVFSQPLRTTILIAPALALSSTAFVLQILTEKNELQSQYGQASFAILLLQDLAVVPLLALIPLLAMPELGIGQNIFLALVESLLILLVIIVLGRYFLHKILHRIAIADNAEIFTATALLIVLGISMITEYIGLSMAMGAFLAGLLISDSTYRHQVIVEIHPFRGLLLGLFFMSMGMAFNIHLLIEQPLVTLSLVILLLVIKFIVLFSLASQFNFKKENSVAVGLMLAQSGEFALILFSLAFQSQIITDLVFQQLVLIVIISMLSTPVLAYFAQKIIHNRKMKNNHRLSDKMLSKPIEAPVIIVGFGHLGHSVGIIFTKLKLPFIALDINPVLVEKESKNNLPVFYGDICKPKLLKAIGAGNAELIIITLHDEKVISQIIEFIKRTYPEKIIYVLGKNLKQYHQLKKLGVSKVISSNIETSIEIARLAMVDLNIDDQDSSNVLLEFRKNYHD